MLAIIVLAITVFVVGSTIYFGVQLGHAVFFSPHPFFPFFGLGFLVLGIVVFGLLAGLLFRPYRRRMYYYGRGRWFQDDTAMESLRQRYARGEITRDQFEQMASDLEKHR